MCASCHNTRLQKNYDASSDSYSTTMAETGVGCEACHGAMSTHTVSPSAGARFTSEQWLSTCGFCHARRGELSGDFVPGQALSDHARLTIVDASDTFFADGKVRDENFEYAAFLGSRMHGAGVTCVDCHDPHSGGTRLPGNQLCMRCHGGAVATAPRIDPEGHSHHPVPAGMAPTPTGGECVSCHMPQTTYMQRHARRDHGFTIPDPLMTMELSIPNACDGCHADRGTAWTLEWVEKWYGDRMERPGRARTRIVAAARRGDATAPAQLVALLDTEPIAYWRAVAAGLLRPWAGDAPVREAWMRAIEDRDALVREAAVRAIEPLSAEAQVQAALQTRLQDTAAAVRIASAWALRRTLNLESPAARELLRALDFHADQPSGQMQLGALRLARGDPNAALGHYEKAVQWDGASAPLRHELAVVLATTGRPADALPHLEKACELEPRAAEYRYKLGLLASELGRSDQAIDALRTAVALEPGHARAWYNLALALEKRGEVEQARVALEQAQSAGR